MAITATTEDDGTAAPDAVRAPPRLGLAARLTEALESERPRWLLWLPVLTGAGIAFYFHLAEEPPLVLALSPFGMALILRSAVRKGTLGVALAGALVALTLGLALAKLRTEWVRAPVLSQRVTAEVRGFVELVEPKPQRGGRLTVRVAAMDKLPQAKWPARVRVRLLGDVSRFKPGDAIRLTASLSPPPQPALPGGYDFARSAWFQRLGAVGYTAREPVPDETLGAPPAGLRAALAIERLRVAIGRRITAALPGETGAIANALITGERGGITEATNDAFRDSGLFHALSISGLHMAVMAGAIFWTLRLLLAAVPYLALHYPIKKWAAAGAAVGALFYLLISGSSPPTERSYLMISIMFLAILLDRSALALRNIALAAMLILLVYPESLLDLGFQMSFAAVTALVAAHEEIQRRWPPGEGAGGLVPWLRELGLPGRAAIMIGAISLSTVIASLAVAPLAAYYFHKSQQYAILGNVLGLPICDLIVMPLALATLVAMPFGLEAFPLWAMGLGIEALVWCARLVASLPGAVTTVPAMPPLAFQAMVAGGIWLALWGGRWRRLGLAGIVAGAALAPFGPRPDLIVGREGRTLAARIDGSRLSALPLNGSDFDLARWLEHDGDSRVPRAVARGDGFACDGSGCTARVGRLRLAVAQSYDALHDDCRRADILVATVPASGPCPRPVLVLDRTALRRGGAHAISIGPSGSLTVVNVDEARGRRPWTGNESRTRRPAARGESKGAAARTATGAGAPNTEDLRAGEASRLQGFAAPHALIDAIGAPPALPPTDGRP